MQSRGRYLGYLVLDVTNILLYSTSVLTKYLVGRPDHSPPVTHSLPTHYPLITHSLPTHRPLIAHLILSLIKSIGK